jgi:regulator of RNase E activity RraA
MNQNIVVNGVYISPGDMIFADNEGVAVIPKKLITEVFRHINDRFKNERNIVSDIASGVTVSDLLRNRGNF